MQNRIATTTSRGMLLAGLLIALPAFVLITSWWRRGILLLVCAAAYFVAREVAWRAADEIASPVNELATRAERAGSGAARFEPLRSGIDQIDRISLVFERRAGELARNLAAEREFASDASHQLRTPLTALLMRLEEISMATDLDEARGEAAIAIDQVERLNGVVNQLLTRNRNVIAEPTTALSLDSVIARLQREFQPAFEVARRSVRVGGQRGLWVQATEGGLTQILGVLLENSLSHGDGTVEVVARRSGPSVVLEVSDLGEGVDPGIAPRIFEREVSTGGTGLGLSLARDLATACGGRLELVRMQPAVFALFLSAASPPPLDRRTALATDLASAETALG